MLGIDSNYSIVTASSTEAIYDQDNSQSQYTWKPTLSMSESIRMADAIEDRDIEETIGVVLLSYASERLGYCNLNTGWGANELLNGDPNNHESWDW